MFRRSLIMSNDLSDESGKDCRCEASSGHQKTVPDFESGRKLMGTDVGHGSLMWWIKVPSS